LEESGSSLALVLRVECYLARPEDFGDWNAIFAETFPAPRPARTTLVAGFTVPGLLIEIQVTAAVRR
jgi:enamine deaminase RidA (YjgF/YER057c/UK114 family)